MRAPFSARLMGRVRGLILRLRILLAGGKCGSRLVVGPRVVFKYPIRSGVRIGHGVEIGSDVVLHIASNARLEIGNASKITGYCHISASERVFIDDECLIAEFVSIRDSDHGIDSTTPIRLQPMTAQPVVIGPGSWIGRGAALLKGTTLAAGCVVGANAVVKGAFEDGSVLVGAPARCVKTRR
jgi:acetyltransferase-like isoleucine patch superfamily enzyme